MKIRMLIFATAALLSAQSGFYELKFEDVPEEVKGIFSENFRYVEASAVKK